MAKNFTQRNNRAYAVGNPLLNVFPEPIVAQRAPTVNDIAEIGREWVDSSGQKAYILVAIVSGSATWLDITNTGGGGVFTSLTVTPGAFNYTGIGSGFTMTSDTASSIGVTGAGIDLTLDSAAGQLILTGGEAAANAVRIQADNAAGGIDVDSGTGGFDVDTTGIVSLTSSLAASEQAILLESTAADSNIKLKLGDDAGATLVDIRDSGDNSVASIDSDGYMNVGTLNLNVQPDGNVGFIATQNMRIFSISPNGENTFVGRDAGAFGGNAVNITVLGDNAATDINDGVGLIAIGVGAGDTVTDGNNNVIIGDNAGDGLQTGSNNIIIGHSAGTSIGAASSENIYIGHVGANESGTIRIGTATEQTVCYIQGIFGGAGAATAVLIDSDGLLGTAPSSIRYKENVEDMADASNALLSLRPVVFNYKSDASKSLQYGLIAEEVYEVMPRLAVLDKEGQPETVKYHELPALLLNELQKALKRIEALEAQLAK